MSEKDRDEIAKMITRQEMMASPALSSLSRYFMSPNPPTNQVVRPGAMGNAPTDPSEIQIPGTFDLNAIRPDDTMRQYFEKDKSQEYL